MTRFFLTAVAAAAAKTYTVKDCKDQFIDGKGPEQLEGTTFLCRMKGKTTFFATSFDNEIHCPVWSAYHLDKAQQDKDQGGRKGFKYDPDVPKEDQASSTADAFKKENRDIGHLAPSSTFSFDKSADGAWDHTYLMTNVAPQGAWFNEHPWAMLERHMRDYVVDNNAELYVVTGVIQANPVKLDGDDAVPQYYYKVWCDPDRKASAGVLGNNDNKCKDQCGTDEIISVKEIEDQAGYTIFPSSMCNTGKAGKDWGFDDEVVAYKYKTKDSAAEEEVIV